MDHVEQFVHTEKKDALASVPEADPLLVIKLLNYFITMKKKAVLEIICFLFILLFTYAAFVKLKDVQKFTVQIGKSPLLTDFAPAVAWGIPLTELAIAIMLASNRFKIIGLYGAFTLMVMFTAYIIAILQFSTYVPCSCGGLLENMGWTAHLVFNIFFVVLAIAGFILHTKLYQKNPALT